MSETQEKQKSFFERMGELLNAPLPGTEAKPQTGIATDKSQQSTEQADVTDDTLLTRIKEILNSPLPGSQVSNDQLTDSSSTNPANEEVKLPEITETDVEENWWETDWAEFKSHQDQDRKGLNMKQRQDQEGFAQYQEQERIQFEKYQAQEFEIFQRQQQAKLNWIQQQQLAQASGVQVAGMVPPPPPVAPLPPEMPTPPWMQV